MSDVFSFANPTFHNFAFYSGLVLGKTILMTPLTSFFRVKNKVYNTPEDIERFAPGFPMTLNHPTVERMRNCHRNDLENILPFTLIGLLYVGCQPDPDLARRIFQVYTASRMLHTTAYVLSLPQPVRVLSFYLGWGTMATMTCLFFAKVISK
ncbi:hypothetical protein ACOMHN_012528 [Nucella lapillus]